jgi:hypothetical protein
MFPEEKETLINLKLNYTKKQYEEALKQKEISSDKQIEEFMKLNPNAILVGNTMFEKNGFMTNEEFANTEETVTMPPINSLFHDN